MLETIFGIKCPKQTTSKSVIKKLYTN